MEIKENEVLFIYDADDMQQKEGLAYAKSLKHYEVKEVNIRKDKLSQLQLTSIADRLGVEPEDLLKDSADKTSLDAHDFLDYLKSNLTELKTPIAVYKNKAKFIGTQYEMIKEDGNDSPKDVQTSQTIRQSKES